MPLARRRAEVLQIDDLDTDDERRAERYLARLRAIKRIGGKIIAFLAQLEDFQKRLFLKKKFVLAADYCLTLDRVPPALHPQIAANDAQWAEWERLFAISELPNAADRAAVLQDNPFLLLDTRFFDAGFKQAVLNEIDDLNDRTDGLLISSENLQALNLLQNGLKGNIGCIYLDPPYNSETSAILYRNSYKHSSWLSLMGDRLLLGRLLLSPDAILITAIDENEQEELGLLLDQTFTGYDKTCVSVVHNPRGIQGGNFAYSHEYAYFVFPEGGQYIKGKPVPRDQWEYSNLRNWGGESTREHGKSLFYPIYVQGDKVLKLGEAPADDFHPNKQSRRLPSGDIEVWPIDQNGVERKWRYSSRSLQLILHATQIVEREGGPQIQIAKLFERPKTVWTDSTYDAGVYGSRLLGNMIGTNFSFPKSLYLVKDCVGTAVRGDASATVLDYFAGSGTTGHAVIDLNREDGGRRKYILVEMGEYFDSVLKPRILKAVYSKDWRDGKPVSREGSSHLLKYLTLESYEDTLNNLRLRERPAAQQRLLAERPALREDYLLSYCLDLETAGSPSLLDLDAFETPFDYTLTVTQGGERRAVPVDLPETFNYLLGLRVQKLRANAGFRTVEGLDPDGARVLVVWRSLRDPATDNAALDRFFLAQGYADRPPDRALDRVYVNGDNTLLNLRPEGASWQALLTEEEFKRLMFTDAGEGGR